MAQEPETLYKLMVLYMLDQVNLPLTGSQLSEFFLGKEYSSWFTLQEVLQSLEESGFLSSSHVGNSTHYGITDDGRQTLTFFADEIFPSVKADMDGFIAENKFRMRSEASVTADYYRPEGGDYVVHCTIREGKSDLFSMDISVPDEAAARAMSANWKARAQSIYGYVLNNLT